MLIHMTTQTVLKDLLKMEQLVILVIKLDGHISDEDYLTCKKIRSKFNMKNMCDYHDHFLKKIYLENIQKEENISVLFYATPSLVQKFVLIEWRPDCYQLADLISSFFRSFVKSKRFVGHFGIFIENKEEGVSQLSLRILPKKKK